MILKINFFLICLFLVVTQTTFSQQVTFKSKEDSSTISVDVFIMHPKDDNVKINSKNGIVDFSTFKKGSQIEVHALDYQSIYFILTDNLPRTIYLKPIIHLDETVITGQLKQTNLADAVQNMRVISRKKIEQMGAQNLTQLFKNELNIQLANDPVLGTSMDIQGISGQNIKLMIDGVPVIGRLNGNIDLNQISTLNIERIEIIEGPLSVNYGSDALGGTINIISRKTQDNLIHAKLYGYYESNGNYNSQLNLSTQLKNTQISVNLNRNYFDGWRNDEKAFHFEKKRIADTLRYKLYKPKEQLYGSIKIRQRLNKSSKKYGLYLTAKVKLFNELIENRGLPTKPYFIKAFDDYYQTKRWDNSLNLVGRLSDKWHINSVNAYNYFLRYKNTYLNDLTTLEQTMAGANEQDTATFDLFLSRSSFIYKHSKKWQLELGYDVNYESTYGKRIENQHQSIGDFALYATSEILLWKKLTLKPGLRYAYNTVYKSPLTPSVFAKFDINKHNQLRASYSRGFRSPSLKELYFNFVDINHNIVGNNNLQAEYSNNYQLSLRTTYNKGFCRFQISNSFFYNDLNHLITLAQVNQTEYSYVNLFNAQTYGYTLGLQFSRKNIAANVGASIKGRKSQLVANQDPQATSMYPEIQFNPSYHFPKLKTSIAVFYKYTGKLPNLNLRSDGSITETRRDAYNMLDLTVTSKFWKERIGITLGVKNLLDVTSINGTSGASSPHSSGSYSIQIGMGRTYFISCTFQIHSKK